MNTCLHYSYCNSHGVDIGKGGLLVGGPNETSNISHGEVENPQIS